jgi:hypothetical protein
MSSPIHKYLFSPPPSPPARPIDSKHRPPPLQLTSVKILLNDQLSPRLPQDELHAELKPRSPRTPQNRNFTLTDKYPSPYPTRTPRNYSDLESGPTPTGLFSNQNTPRVIVHEPSSTPRRTVTNVIIASPPLLPTNSPTTSTSNYTVPLPSSLPKPLLRLLFLATLVISSIMILILVPASRLPSLRDASVSRRLALAEDGKAFMDVMHPVKSWVEGKDRDYVPAKVKSTKMMKRGSMPEDRAVVPRKRSYFP